jgi:outer membrane protein assembly factor BamD
MSPRFVGLRGLLLLPLAALVFTAGCQSTGKRDQQKLSRYTPEVLYDRGQKALQSANYKEAVQDFEALTARYPFTPQSRQGRLNIIYAYYKLDEKESAKDAADTFIRENPTHPRIDYAWYLKGLIDFERVPYRLERWLDVTLVDRPPSTAREAFISLRTVVERFPKSPYAADARRRMIYLRNRVADYELGIAQYYAQRDAWVAAGQRARETIEQYDGAPAVKDALRIMYRSYIELDYKELAANTEKVFHENYPEDSIELPKHARNWWKFWT